MNKDSILLSPKHGLNPSIVKCFWCGKDIGIALMGKLKGDVKAPKDIIESYMPCDECKEHFRQGILVAGVSNKPVVNNLPPIAHNEAGEPFYFDSSHVVMTLQEISHILDDQAIIDAAIEKRILLAPNELVRKIVQDMSKLQEEEQNEQNNSKTSVGTGNVADKKD